MHFPTLMLTRKDLRELMETHGENLNLIKSFSLYMNKRNNESPGPDSSQSSPRRNCCSIPCVNPCLELSDPTCMMPALRKGSRKLGPGNCW